MIRINFNPSFALRDFVQITLFVFFLSCILFPADFYHIKKISFVVALLLGWGKIIECIGFPKYRPVLFFAIIFPIGTIIHSMILGSELGRAVSDGYTGILFLLLIVICEYNINYEAMLIKCLKILCYITLLLVILDIAGISDLNVHTPIRKFIYDYGIGYVGKSFAYAAYYKVFIKTSPLLILLLCYSFDNRKWIDVVLSFIALVLSGTRANIFVSFGLLMSMFFLYKTENANQKHIKYIAMGIVILVGVFFIPRVLGVAADMMSTTGSITSDAVRSGQLQGLYDSLEDPVKLMFGVGYGNVLMFDYGRGKDTYEFELSYFCLLMKIGLLWFLSYIVFLIIPFFKKISVSTKVILLGYLVIAYSNPLLYTSTAMIMLIYVYYKSIENIHAEYLEPIKGKMVIEEL